jgi:hypothetical protein
LNKPPAGGRRKRPTRDEWQFSLRERWFHVTVSGPPERLKIVTLDDSGRVQSRESLLAGREAESVAFALARELVEPGQSAERH